MTAIINSQDCEKYKVGCVAKTHADPGRGGVYRLGGGLKYKNCCDLKLHHLLHELN
jgi:hypothetical protein